ncbi:MAG: hypothetical protein ACI4OJ_07520 [Lachnospiraceae bacterium]
MRSKRLLALTLTGMLFFATGCSQMQFIATGKEFKSICEDNGLTVTDITDALSEENGYTSLNSAYTAVPDSGAFTVNYASFSNSKEAENYYSSIADQMDGVEYNGTNYKAEVETVGDTVREIYMESGRIVYAEGDKQEVNQTDSLLMSGWSKPGKVTDSSSEASTEADTEETEEAASDEASTAATTKESSSAGSTAKTSSSTAADTSSTKDSSAGADTGTQITVVDPTS